MIFLEINQAVKSYRAGGRKSPARKVLNGIDLSLEPGEIIGITGDSGAGKTTLGLIIAGILRPDSGTVYFAGTDLWNSNATVRKSIRRGLQIVFQHPESTFDPRWTIRRSLSEPFMLCGIRPGLSLLADRLAEVELNSAVMERHPRQLSGGELQRIAIARIMALNPKVVVLDEPTAMLDALTQARIMNLLERIRQRTGVAYVLISHDTDMVNRFCPLVYQLSDGRLE